MAKIERNQKEYIKAYEALTNEGTNVSALIMLTEMSYEEKEKQVEYKDFYRFKSKNYCSKIDVYYRHMLSTFFKIDKASSIYNSFKEIFGKVYLDNKDDDTNDYTDETMIKINKIYSFINNIGDQDLKGTELLSLIRREITDGEIDDPLKDDYFDSNFEKLKKRSDQIQFSDVDNKMSLVDNFLSDVGEMESHLFKKKLFYDDYRKTVTGLTNYLFIRAGIPVIYIKPIELDDYYKYILKSDKNEDIDIVTFYKEKMCDSIEDVLVIPMKNAISYYIDNKYKQEAGLLDNKIVTLRQNKYK